MSNWNKIKQEEIDLIISKKYNSNDLSKILNRHQGTINKIARENKITLPRRIIRKYKIDECFFDVWNENNAYWLGFISADGCILEDKRGNPAILNIALSKKDETHLIQFRDLICKDIPIKYKEKYNSVSLSVCSKILCNKLVNLGIIPRKSITLKWINCIPKEYIHHFIRGYFDGDGYIRVRTDKKYGYKNLEFNMLGTENFLCGIKNEFNKIYKKDIGKIKSCKKWYNSYTISFFTKSALCFGHWIYDDSNIKLDRKYKIYNEYVSSLS
jgi:intein-encoded DNA endonuclease-like protein